MRTRCSGETPENKFDPLSMDTTTSKPMVCVWMITYNHSNYIQQAIESVLNQNCQFDFVIQIGDDCSKDDTSKICAKYARMYPEVINYARRHKNLGMISNALVTLSECLATGSKYIAMLEGDDYWTDTHKLQNQIHLLEQNPNASFCFSRVDLLFEHFLKSHKYQDMDDYPELISLDDYLNHYYPIPNLTKVFRSSNVPDYSKKEWGWLKDVRFLDNVFHMLDLMKGPAIFLDQATGVYRIHGESATRSAPEANSWHLEEILLTHYHFAGMSQGKIRDKFEAIRAMHFEKLISFYIALKRYGLTMRVVVRYIFDDRSGSFGSRINSTLRTINMHLAQRGHTD